MPSRCPPEFVFLYREFGGDLSLRDDQGRLATDIAENAPSLKTLRTLQGMVETLSWIYFTQFFNSDVLQSFAIICQIFLDHPLSLQSICRLAIRNELGPHRFCQIQKLPLDHAESGGVGLAPYLIDFLEYRQLFLSVQQLPESNSWNNATHTKAVKLASKVIREVISPRIHYIIYVNKAKRF